MDRLWRPDRQLVHGYLCFEESAESQVATWIREITEFALRSGYQPGSIFIDRYEPPGGFARSGFIALLSALRLPGAYGVVIPSLAHLSSDPFTQQVLIHMVQLTDSQLLVSANSNASSPTALSAEASSGVVPPEQISEIKAAVGVEFARLQAVAETDMARSHRSLQQVKDRRKKLLDAHYQGAIPTDMLKSEMQRLTVELASAEGELAVASANLTDLEDQLRRALVAAGHCAEAYEKAPPAVRRQLNQGFFKKLYIDEDGDVQGVDRHEPFAPLLTGVNEAYAFARPGDAPTDAQTHRNETDEPIPPHASIRRPGDDLGRRERKNPWSGGSDHGFEHDYFGRGGGI